jgi:hypothetical protein
MINWEGILPKKKSFTGDEIANEMGYSNELTIVGTYNGARNECIEALRKAEKNGEICKPLSKEQLIELLDTYDLVDGSTIDRMYDNYLSMNTE